MALAYYYYNVIYNNYTTKNLKNKALFKPGARRTWFLEIDPVRERLCVCECVCVSAPEAINNYWRDMDPI